MINKISFTGRETMLGAVVKNTENIAKDYVCAGKVYSNEERFLAATNINNPNVKTKHPYVSPYMGIKNIEKTDKVAKKAEDVDVDFVAETAPHRFNVIG